MRHDARAIWASLYFSMQEGAPDTHAEEETVAVEDRRCSAPRTADVICTDLTRPSTQERGQMKRGAGKRRACCVRHHRSRSDNWRRGGRASHISWLLQAEALQRARADEEAVAVGENALHTARPFGSVDKKPLSTWLKNRRRSHAWQNGNDRRFCARLPCLTCWHAPDTCPATVLCSFFCYIKMQAAAMMRRQGGALQRQVKQQHAAIHSSSDSLAGALAWCKQSPLTAGASQGRALFMAS